MIRTVVRSLTLDFSGLFVNMFAASPWDKLSNPAGASWNSWGGIMGNARSIIILAMNLSAVVCVGVLVYGGYTYITSQGDPEKIQKGTNIISAGIIGFIIVMISRLIFQFLVDEVLGGIL